jgi:hypothetical protein
MNAKQVSASRPSDHSKKPLLVVVVALAVLVPTAGATGLGVPTPIDDPFCMIDINAQATPVAAPDALDCDGVALTIGVAGQQFGDTLSNEGGDEIHCGFQHSNDGTGCSQALSSPKIRYWFIVYCSAACSSDWQTDGKIFSYSSCCESDTGLKFGRFYATYINGRNQGTQNDVNCNEFAKKSTTVEDWSGGLSVNSGCIGSTTPHGGWDAGIKLK